MTMQSSNLLTALRELSGGESGQERSFRDNITNIVSMDRAMYAAEFAAGVSGGMWAIFGEVNVDDAVRENLNQAHELAFPEYDGTLTEHWEQVIQEGPFSMRHFAGDIGTGSSYITVSNELSHQGFTGISIPDLGQPISAIAPDGQEVSIRVVADSDYANLDEHLDLVITQAYEMSSSNIAADFSVSERWQMVDQDGFINNNIGKVAEIRAHQQWGEIDGVEAVDFVRGENGLPDPRFEGPDLTAMGPDGQELVSQVKFGDASYIDDPKVVDWIHQMHDNANSFIQVSSEMHGTLVEANPEIADRILDIGSSQELREQIIDRLDILSENPVDIYALGTDTYQEILSAAPGMEDQITDVEFDFLHVEDITDGLDTLSSNLGIDVPDGVVDIIPYAGAIVAGARLVYSIVKTEKEFKEVDRTTKNKIQVVQSLTVMSRIGVTATLAAAGGAGGGALGSVVPGVGNLVGGLAGTLGGAGMGMYLNRHLQPHMLNLALNITGLTNDDLFYYKNKPRIDTVALSFSQQARALAAPA